MHTEEQLQQRWRKNEDGEERKRERGREREEQIQNEF
jgi:hypothetical protein